MRNFCIALATLLLCLCLSTARATGDTLVYFAKSTVVPGSSWKYLADGSNQGTAWRAETIDESVWVTGNSQLGYGGDGENTIVPYGPSASNKYITTYFRKTINIPDPSAYVSFILSVKRDDGIIVYVNGAEVYTNNISSGAAYNALAALAGDDGDAILTTNLPTSTFKAGSNTIAVEIHQNGVASTDITFDLELVGSSGIVTRGPYLQMGGQTGITIRWQSDVATNSRVRWGTSFGTYPNVVDDATVSTSHLVNIAGLSPDTKYYYSIGSTTATLQAAFNNYFITAPPAGSTRKLRFVALGDCGNASTNQVDTKNAMLKYIGTNEIDGLITLGDNAYSSGLDGEFQTGFFNIYQNDILRYMKLYPTPGNHDYGNNPANTGVRNNAYYNNFTVPTAAQLGGVASGTAAYYSFDIGDVHFLSLDSYGKENTNTTNVYDTSGAQATWVKNDLTANTKKWVVVYFHHPPYTKTSHDSDTETDLRAMRERFIRILERYGVDLILNGHAHGYERSYLLKNYYNTYASPLTSAMFVKKNHTADSSSAFYNGDVLSCPYNYNSGQYNHGSVYIVAGSAGQIGGSAAGYPHKAMVYSNNTNGGGLYFEVDSNRLEVKFISYNGTGAGVTDTIMDQFTIFKDVNKVTNITVVQNDPLVLNASWRGAYYWPNNGAASTQSVQPSTATPGIFDFIVKDASTGSCIKDSFHVVVTGTLAISNSSFSALLNKDKVLLNWATTQDQNNKYFTVEKSKDGINYILLGKVNAGGTSTVYNQYKLTDFQPYEGTNYYRLSQTDFDNRTKSLAVKAINYKTTKDFSANIIQVGPGNINVLLNNKVAGPVTFKVTDILGKELFKQQINVPSGAYTKNIQLTKGVYVIQISNTNQRVTQKMLVE